MSALDRLAFVDLETTGLAATRDRITEIGIVTLNGRTASEWSTLINPGRPVSDRTRPLNGITNEVLKTAPRFRDIALELKDKLAGHLFVAHNARFDFSFLRAEFHRAGIEFAPQALCSVMLSRRLHPEILNHDLDTLIGHFGLNCDTRHRALPDARALLQLWNIFQLNHSHEKLLNTIETLLKGPLLPAHLDPSLVDRLPEAPGVYLMLGENQDLLHLGKASNLKCHMTNYFRTDRVSQKALNISHRVRNITWRRTDGALGAHLKLAQLRRHLSPSAKNDRTLFSWTLRPESFPCIEIVSLSQWAIESTDHYGIFESEKKARNALQRFALKNGLCLALLGVSATDVPCLACNSIARKDCGPKSNQLRKLMKIITVLLPNKVARWPYPGPIGLRERRDLHIINEWRYLGTANTENEIDGILADRAHEFEETTFSFLARTLPKLATHRIVPLPLPDLWRDG